MIIPDQHSHFARHTSIHKTALQLPLLVPTTFIIKGLAAPCQVSLSRMYGLHLVLLRRAVLYHVYHIPFLQVVVLRGALMGIRRTCQPSLNLIPSTQSIAKYLECLARFFWVVFNPRGERGSVIKQYYLLECVESL